VKKKRIICSESMKGYENKLNFLLENVTGKRCRGMKERRKLKSIRIKKFFFSLAYNSV
jgi:hypothetical protein